MVSVRNLDHRKTDKLGSGTPFREKSLTAVDFWTPLLRTSIFIC